MYHTPVMLRECLEGLNIKPEGIYVDVTYGGGGHARGILEHLDKKGRLIAFDQDEDALQNKIDDDRLTLIHQNFSYVKNFCKLYGYGKVNGIFADLGVSSHQLDVPEKGFSTRFEGKLDMRMSAKTQLTAANIVNEYERDELIRIFKLYGELQNSAKIADGIIRTRTVQPIETTSQLMKIITPMAPRMRENKFAAQLFQALRIETNKEMEALSALLQQSVDLLSPEGRLVILSYHSLEDRLVKNFMRSGNFEGVIEKDFYGNPLTPFNIITRKPITASEEEIVSNNRARSAKLRIAKFKSKKTE
ncbi:MAG: 16S rRNA (cytosine(1402)-N(4))-methyltransferase RsmH [Bacteroidales bacterium]|jgi:16S rRNA (cytosine1402-N4)-methyltransferase|nr:16S rRNA (cytosine(1402)-N(4))-methyltransferase RsmH [Bacteroidales bacterium]